MTNALARFFVSLGSPILGAARARRLVARTYAIGYLVFFYLSAQYARAALGMLWIVLSPVLFLAVYLPVMTYVFKASLPGSSGPWDYALFIVAGFLPWSAFSDGFGQGAASLANNAAIVRHSPTPPGTLPLVKVSVAFAGLLAGLFAFVVLLTLLGRFPGVRLVLLPVSVGLLYIFSLGLAWLFSSLAVYVRDILQLIPSLLLVEFFACPVVYSPRSDMGPITPFIQWNPLTPFLALFRAALAPTAEFAWVDLFLASVWAGGAFMLGTLVFRRLQDGLADAV